MLRRGTAGSRTICGRSLPDVRTIVQLQTTRPVRPDLPPMRVEMKRNPNFYAPEGTTLLASARTDLRDHTAWTVTRWGIWRDETRPVTHVDGGSFEDAVRAASELVRIERAATKWGFFDRHQGRVDALAVVQAASGWDLVPANQPVDPYIDFVPGGASKMRVDPRTYIFEHGDVRREADGVAALVGETHVYDLRGTSPSGPTEPA